MTHFTLLEIKKMNLVPEMQDVERQLDDIEKGMRALRIQRGMLREKYTQLRLIKAFGVQIGDLVMVLNADYKDVEAMLLEGVSFNDGNDEEDEMGELLLEVMGQPLLSDGTPDPNRLHHRSLSHRDIRLHNTILLRRLTPDDLGQSLTPRGDGL